MNQIPVQYIVGDETLLNQMEPLWLELNGHHLKLSPYFKQDYETFTFARRKSMFEEKAGEGKLRVELAEDGNQNALIGFCVSSVGRGQGEVESIYVQPAYRGQGIGDHFMESALAWMDEAGISQKTVHVASGNEDAFTFYARYGFYPRQTILKQKALS